MYSCLEMTVPRLQAGAASSRSVATAKNIRNRQRREGFTSTTFHYNARQRGARRGAIVTRRMQGPTVSQRSDMQRTPPYAAQCASRNAHPVDTTPCENKSMDWLQQPRPYQTRQAGLRIIAASALQPKALANSGTLETTPLTRQRSSGGCVLAASGGAV